MPIYRCTLDETRYYSRADIEADDEEDALEKYRDKISDGEIDYEDSEYNNETAEEIREERKKRGTYAHRIQRLQKNRENAFWYKGYVARVYWYALVTTGNAQVNFQDKKYHDTKRSWYEGEKAIKEALRRKYTDNDIVSWEMREKCFFDVVKITKNKKMNVWNIKDASTGRLLETYTQGIKELINARNSKMYG
jgi:hypothetical protein